MIDSLPVDIDSVRVGASVSLVGLYVGGGVGRAVVVVG